MLLERLRELLARDLLRPPHVRTRRRRLLRFGRRRRTSGDERLACAALEVLLPYDCGALGLRADRRVTDLFLDLADVAGPHAEQARLDELGVCSQLRADGLDLRRDVLRDLVGPVAE